MYQYPDRLRRSSPVLRETRRQSRFPSSRGQFLSDIKQFTKENLRMPFPSRKTCHRDMVESIIGRFVDKFVGKPLCHRRNPALHMPPKPRPSTYPPSHEKTCPVSPGIFALFSMVLAPLSSSNSEKAKKKCRKNSCEKTARQRKEKDHTRTLRFSCS